MSAEETKFRELLTPLFLKTDNFIFNWRPDFLKNPATGMNLEIDIYIGKYRAAFEYQGGVHFKDIKRFKNDSDKSRKHDSLKHTLILLYHKNDMSLIEIFPEDLTGDFKANLLLRIENTISAYLISRHFNQVAHLERLVFFLKYSNVPLTEKQFEVDALYKKKLVNIRHLDGINRMRPNMTDVGLVKHMKNMGLEEYTHLFLDNG